RAQLETNEALEAELAIRKIIAEANKKEREAEIKFRERAAQLGDEMEAARAGRREQYDRQLGSVGLSDRTREQIEAQASIYREAQRLQAQLLKSTPEHMLGSKEYMAEVVRIKEHLDKSLADHNAYYDALRKAQGNMSVGMS